jgi:hypothetical protein
MFLLGWVLGLAVVSGVVYVIADASDAATDSTASDTVSWGKVGLGVLLVVLARRQWAKRPAPGVAAPMPRWMATVDSITPVRAFGLAVVLSVVNPKNLVLTLAAGAGLGQVAGLSTTEAVVSLVVFVVLASVSIAAPVAYDRFGGADARAKLDELKAWLGEHNAAVMATLFAVFGVVLIAKGIGLLSA